MSASAQSGPEQPPPSAPGPPLPTSPDDDLILYDYTTPPFQIRDSAIKAAEIEIQLLLEDADENGEDLTGASFCGCETCVDRVHAAFWISWTLEALRSGDLTVVPIDDDAPFSDGATSDRTP